MNKKIVKKIIILPLLILVSLLFSFSISKDYKNNLNIINSHSMIKGKEKWEDHFFAPFADMAGAQIPDLSTYMDDSKASAQYFNLGFLQPVYQYYDASGNTHEISKDKGENVTTQWAWGGYRAYSKGSTDPHYLGIAKEIEEVRQKGGDVAVSLGGAIGAGGSVLWYDASVEQLETMYHEIIDEYSLTRIDLDIEGTTESIGNANNAKALAAVQKETGIKVDITLPVTSRGLDGTGQSVLQTYYDSGLEIDKVNIMAMLFHSGDVMASEMISSMEGTCKQIQSIFGISEEEAYAKLGVTNSIGKEQTGWGSPPQYSNFSSDEAKKEFTFVEEHDLGMLSMWVINRDAHLPGYGDPETGGHWGGGYDGEDWRYCNIFGKFVDHDDAGGGDISPPSVPGNLSSKDVTDLSITLNWDPSSDEAGGSGMSHYLVNITDNNGFTKDATTEGVVEEITFDGLTPDISYDLKVAAVDKKNNTSSFSSPLTVRTNPKEDHTPPSAPTGLVKNSTTSSSVSYSWDSSTDEVGGSGMDHYIGMIKKRDGTGEEITKDTPNTDTNITFDGLEAKTDYLVKTKAVDVAGNESVPSSSIVITTDDGEGDITPPSIPNGLSNGGTTETSVTLKWLSSTDETGGSGMSHYEIKIKDDSGYSDSKNTSTPSELEITFNGLSAGTTYHLSVIAVDVAGNKSNASTIFDIETNEHIGDNTPPSEVGGLSLNGSTNNSLTIFWLDAVDPDAGDSVDHYVVTLDTKDKEEILSTEVSGKNEYTFNNLDKNVEYIISIYAVDTHNANGKERSLNAKTSNISEGKEKTKLILMISISSVIMLILLVLVILLII